MRNEKPKNIVHILKRGDIGVMPTDTIYGLVGSAFKPKTVQRIYRLRRRNPKKPMIILIGSLKQLKLFGIRPDRKITRLLWEIWLNRRAVKPFSNSRELENRPTSVILPLKAKSSKLKARLRYLHRGTNSLAFRLPRPPWLRRLLAKVGPLVAPSANPEGRSPARTIRQAKKYFGDKVDFYIDGGRISGKPSRLVQLIDEKIKILRK